MKGSLTGWCFISWQVRGRVKDGKGILEVVCEEAMHVDYVLVIQSSAFKPGSGSFQTVQSRTWSQGFDWIFPHNAFVAVILQSIHALGTWRNKILGLDLCTVQVAGIPNKIKVRSEAKLILLWTTSLPDICHFWYATALFRPVKSSSKLS